ncbi:hypothetical protein M2459_001360 [Parabacteroides sp. PF5-5]|uniref:hypothetical protein n=1 Tax=unclassified Parabacteroides TaxID=2649774 RepID=UPI0024753129|nr:MULTISPECIES: hypothetical protein [unclassified Parabacteroides]MDH6304625.1 hypothetical protein [Parabacteroides sp. PH5-39]MDH6315762.1 hypothetical protein [Parabacteroides sp. PF5-13]MDH6319421.1 hypothetical protein [Parabacteroides sp. PH5-13]MDH6323152.1 hypothetical protein [Parabacteroides sp. PH5-8]MDH6326954.1 hypothetical protein [Parabacteroides sp. PH5-41]
MEVKWTIEYWKNVKVEEHRNKFFIHGYGKIAFLHELQNYYYLFEKKELEIEL